MPRLTISNLATAARSRLAAARAWLGGALARIRTRLTTAGSATADTSATAATSAKAAKTARSAKSATATTAASTATATSAAGPRLSLAGAPTRFAEALKARRPLAIAGAVALIVVLLGAGIAAGGLLSSGSSGGAEPTTEPSPGGPFSPSPSATPTETLPDILSIPTAGPTATAYPAQAVATTDGELLPFWDANLATRRPIAVMLDDHWAARPQAGVSQANIVYQALAEGGIPRYMAIFQTQDPPQIGPIRSARLYFVAWAEEWQAMYIHVWGAPNAMNRLATDNKIHVWNADGLRYLSTRYMWRVDWRVKPHNAYTDGASLQNLLVHLGGGGAGPKAFWTFTEGAPEMLRPVGGTIDIPYYYNDVQYKYDRATNTYLRYVTTDVIRHRLSPNVDWNNNRQVAPSNVVLMYMDTYMLAGHANLKKGRLDLNYLGKGKAVVFQNGQAIPATWSKKAEYSPTYLLYASGPDKGKLIPFVRGQIYVQVVPSVMPVTWTLGTTVAPGY